jgi:hypothetical protein
MKKRRSTPSVYAQNETLTVRTGDHCPETGWWRPVQSEMPTTSVSRFVAQGSVMPAVAGTPAFWVSSSS